MCDGGRFLVDMETGNAHVLNGSTELVWHVTERCLLNYLESKGREDSLN